MTPSLDTSDGADGSTARIGRRGFLAASAATLALVACDPASRRSATATASPSGSGDAKSEREFLLDSDTINLSTFILASHPRPVSEAIARHRQALDANPRRYLQLHEAELESAVVQAAATYLRTSADQIALTDSTTMGLGLVYGGMAFGPGDEVLTTTHDFYATHESLRLRRARDGISVRSIEVYGDPRQETPASIAARIRDAVRPSTRALALTWVHSSTGVKLPIHEIAAEIRSLNSRRRAAERVLVCVDAVHGFGVEDVTPADLGCDLFVTGCHKWLFGPRGTGIVWGTSEAWEKMRPIIPTFDGRAYQAWLVRADRRDPPPGFEPPPVPPPPPPGPYHTPGGFHSFEHRWALADAFTWRTQRGPAAAEHYTHALAARLKDGISQIGGRVSLVTPVTQDLSSGIVCVNTDLQDPAVVVQQLELDHGIIASVTPYAQTFLRLGPSIANSEADVDAAIDAIATVAR